MILRLESSASRWVFFVASVLLAAPLIYFSLRSAWAEHLAESGTREALERATQLEPGDARNWYLLGRDFQYNLEAPDNARAIAAYRQALSFDPRSPAVWLDLAEAHETQGDLASALKKLLADGVGPDGAASLVGLDVADVRRLTRSARGASHLQAAAVSEDGSGLRAGAGSP